MRVDEEFRLALTASNGLNSLLTTFRPGAAGSWVLIRRRLDTAYSTMAAASSTRTVTCNRGGVTGGRHRVGLADTGDRGRPSRQEQRTLRPTERRAVPHILSASSSPVGAE
jgi:hypothetical protein